MGENAAKSDTDTKQSQDIESLKGSSRRRESLAHWLTVLGFLTAFASMGIAFLQWRAMREQLADAREEYKRDRNSAAVAAKESLERYNQERTDAANAQSAERERFLVQLAAQQRNADTSAALTRRSIDESRESFEVANRARLASSGFSRVQLQATVPFVIEISVSNTGNVPAQYVDARSAVFVTRKSLPEAPDMTGADLSAPGSSVGAGLGFTVSSVLDSPVPDKAFVEAVASGDLLLYFVGRVQYNDGFSRTRRTLWFCGQYQVGPVPQWNLCPNNNWSD